MVPWVRCGTLLYRFLIFALFLYCIGVYLSIYFCLLPVSNIRYKLRTAKLEISHCNLVVTAWEKAGVFLCFCHFPISCPRSGVVLDRIDS